MRTWNLDGLRKHAKAKKESPSLRKGKPRRKPKKNAQVKALEEFYRFASKIAKRDKWFLGGFLGAVWEEWNEKHPNKRLG